MTNIEYKLPRATCPVCGKDVTESYVDDHMRNMHGVRGGREGRVKRTHAEVEKGVSLEAIKKRAKQLAKSPAPVTKEWVRPDEVNVPTQQAVERRKTEVLDLRPLSSKPITRVANMEVVTDGERIGIVEWQEP